MEATRNVWLDATKYKPSDIQDYIMGQFIAIRIIDTDCPSYEYDITIGWYDTYKEKFIIPEKYINYEKYIVQDFCVLPKLKF